ncbi:hypothetical protein RVIR1_04060 [Candidatus Rickettsiella viridis]|uniref:Uncharacterized protein n=1 Tax=Candidatus Rickettsiella viridis TaxID=676208 RepID=A0A2Z5UVD4_9COXI|nr:hypothetical protein RVIR1_04060 [Candidatus Rickettsiella viridis]
MAQLNKHSVFLHLTGHSHLLTQRAFNQDTTNNFVTRF